MTNKQVSEFMRSTLFDEILIYGSDQMAIDSENASEIE